MFSASYFVPAERKVASQAPVKERRSNGEKAGGSVGINVAAAIPAAGAVQDLEQAPWIYRAARLAVVLGLHAALLAWIVQSSPEKTVHAEPIRLDVRTVEMPAAAAARPLPVNTLAPKHRRR